jgi:hypothetical protein
MKVKNIEILQDKIDREMFWRREEIIRLNIRANQPSENATILRAGYLLLYSSWEGFIRSIANLYVVFVLVAVELGHHIFDPCSKFIANLIGLTLEFSQN